MAARQCCAVCFAANSSLTRRRATPRPASYSRAAPPLRFEHKDRSKNNMACCSHAGRAAAGLRDRLASRLEERPGRLSCILAGRIPAQQDNDPRGEARRGEVYPTSVVSPSRLAADISQIETRRSPVEKRNLVDNHDRILLSFPRNDGLVLHCIVFKALSSVPSSSPDNRRRHAISGGRCIISAE